MARSICPAFANALAISLNAHERNFALSIFERLGLQGQIALPPTNNALMSLSLTWRLIVISSLLQWQF